MKLLVTLILALCLAGCESYRKFASGYDRSYSISVETQDGAKVGAGVTLHPIKGFAK